MTQDTPRKASEALCDLYVDRWRLTRLGHLTAAETKALADINARIGALEATADGVPIPEGSE